LSQDSTKEEVLKKYRKQKAVIERFLSIMPKV